jgi:membrane protein YdbS with pleckstrin-like domain
VPRDPPKLPARPGEDHMRRRPDAGWLSYRKIVFWILALIIDAFIVFFWALIAVASLPIALLLTPIAIPLIVLPDVIAYVAIHVRYDTTWYIISPRSVRIRRGVWVISEVTVTFENIQDVQIKQGPIQRHFGIADLVVQVAGGGAVGPHGEGMGSHMAVIEGVEDARELRDLILSRVRESKSAGLGDDHSEALPKRTPGHAWTPEHLAVLRELRDLAQARRGA